MQEERCLSCLYWLEPNFLISILSSNIFVYLIEIQKCYLFTNVKPYQLGPFIDSEHPEIRKGMLDRSFDEIFHLEILRRVSQWLNCFGNFFMFPSFIIFFLILFFLYYLFQLQDHVEYMGSAARVILVPSIRDAHHDFVFPQVIRCLIKIVIIIIIMADMRFNYIWFYLFCSLLLVFIHLILDIRY